MTVDRSSRRAKALALVTMAIVVGGAAALVAGLRGGDDGGDGSVSTTADGASPRAAAEVTTSLSVVDGEIQVTCGHGYSWPASVMKDGVSGEFGPDDARAAFADLLADPAIGSELRQGRLTDGLDTEYRVLQDGDDDVVLGLGRWTDEGPVDDMPVALASDLALTRADDRWVYAGGGYCPELRPAQPASVTWEDLETARADADDPSTIVIEVAGSTCDQEPGPILDTPLVVETDESVTIYVTSAVLDGAVGCIEGPTVTARVPLQDPLGTRRVLDGSTWPPRAVP